MMRKGVFCDTSFFIRFLDKSDALHSNARGYYQYFIENDFPLLISTIAIAEYCVGGDLNQLPLKMLQIVPFNFNHSKKTGEFAKIAFQNKGSLKPNDRNIIPNDTKLFAQADCENSVGFYLSADTESFKIYKLLTEKANANFQFIDVNVPHHETFGMLNFG